MFLISIVLFLKKAFHKEMVRRILNLGKIHIRTPFADCSINSLIELSYCKLFLFVDGYFIINSDLWIDFLFNSGSDLPS